MANAIREKIMVLFAKRRKISRALSPGILPGIIHQLNAASRGLGHLKVSKVTQIRLRLQKSTSMKKLGDMWCTYLRNYAHVGNGRLLVNHVHMPWLS